jgi:TonB family protein
MSDDTNSVSSQRKYDDSENGLKREFEEALKVAKKHDRTNLVSLTTNMVLPDPHLWFMKVFGAQIGADYEKQYAQSVPQLRSKLADVFEKFTAQKFTDLKVLRFTKACDDNADEIEYPLLVSRETEEPLSVVDFGRGASFYPLKFFAYVDGAFRYVGELKPYPVPNGGVAKTKPIKVNPFALAAIKETPPAYPDKARRMHLQGEVVLDTIIRKDGTTAIVRVLKGPCVLAASAIKAVEQWQFSPTKVGGVPTDVETDIPVTFTMGP